MAAEKETKAPAKPAEAKSSKVNKDGFEPGKPVDPQAYQKYMNEQRLKANKK